MSFVHYTTPTQPKTPCYWFSPLMELARSKAYCMDDRKRFNYSSGKHLNGNLSGIIVDDKWCTKYMGGILKKKWANEISAFL